MMREFQVSLLALIAISALVPGELLAGPFRRSHRRMTSVSTTTRTYATSVSATQVSTAQVSTAQVSTAQVSTAQVSTAQGVAELMAQYGRVGHFGGNPGYEGCGCGSTPQAAYNNCCYSNSGMATVDVGYAKGSNGMWYCCRRYN